jgi:hypothetical protein
LALRGTKSGAIALTVSPLFEHEISGLGAVSTREVALTRRNEKWSQVVENKQCTKTAKRKRP